MGEFPVVWFNGPRHHVGLWLLRGASAVGLALFGGYVAIVIKVLT